MPNWSIWTERIGEEAIFWTVQWIAGQPVMSSDCRMISSTPEGDQAEFDLPLLGVIPLP